MSINRTAMDATLAVNKVATAPGVGLMLKLKGERAALNPVSQAEGS